MRREKVSGERMRGREKRVGVSEAGVSEGKGIRGEGLRGRSEGRDKKEGGRGIGKKEEREKGREE